jgi:hypothetical protein
MAPEERASLAELARLRRELSEDRAAVLARTAELRLVAQRTSHGLDKPWLAYTAVALHGWYTALEAFFERVARVIDGDVPQGISSHRDLLSQAITEIPGVRMAIVPPELKGELTSLLAFRHFFRHAYAVELDEEKLRREVDRVLRIDATLTAALDSFDATLAAAERALQGA